MARRSSDPWPRISKLLSSTNPDEHWFYTGPYSSVNPGRLRANLTMGHIRTLPRKSKTSDFALKGVTRAFQPRPRIISYYGVIHQFHEAVYKAVFGLGPHPKIRVQCACGNYQTLDKIYPNAPLEHRLARRFWRCCNPYHAVAHEVAKPIPEPEPPSPWEENWLLEAMREWLQSTANNLATIEEFRALYYDHGDHKIADLNYCAQILSEDDGITPRWRKLLKDMLGDYER